MEKKKQLKIAKIFFFTILALLLLIILCPVDSGSEKEKAKKYTVRKKEANAAKTKTTIEIVLPQKESTEKLEEISKQFRKKHKTDNVLIFFFLTDTQKHNYAHASWHGDKFDGVSIFQPIYGDLGWFIDELKMPNTEILGIWGDTLEIDYMIGMVKNKNSTVLKTGYLKSKHILSQKMQTKNDNGEIIYYSKEDPDKHEAYIIRNNSLLMFGRFFEINGKKEGGELEETLPPIDYKKAAD